MVKSIVAFYESQEKNGHNFRFFINLRRKLSSENFCRKRHVYKLLKDRNLKQKEITALLGIKQPEVSHLMNGHFNRFTTDKLPDFLKRLDRKVTIQISPHKPGEPYQEVGFGL